MSDGREQGQGSRSVTRRDLIVPGPVHGGAFLAAAALGVAPALAQFARGEPAAGPAWTMMFDILVRFPAGRLDDWIHFWGDKNVAVLEQGGQLLWGAWYGLTGQQNTATHQWAYRDLAHFQDMAKMRMTNPAVRAAAATGAVPIEETLFSGVMTPLSYHPAQPPAAPAAGDAVIVTQRIARTGPGDGRAYAGLMKDFVPIAAATGAELHGAFETFFGWTPSYILHVWRYRSMEQYWSSRDALARSPDGARLLAAMRTIHPAEHVDLHRPMPYSRLR